MLRRRLNTSASRDFSGKPDVRQMQKKSHRGPRCTECGIPDCGSFHEPLPFSVLLPGSRLLLCFLFLHMAEILGSRALISVCSIAHADFQSTEWGH